MAESTKPVLSIVMKKSVGFTFSNTRGKPKLTPLRGGQEESWPVSPHLEREFRGDWVQYLGNARRTGLSLFYVQHLTTTDESFLSTHYLWPRVAGRGNQTVW